MATTLVIDDVAGPHTRKVVSPARAVEREVEAAWRRFSAHEDACQLCQVGRTRTDRCRLGVLLLDHWVMLKDLQEQPSRWNQVDVRGG